ncbi:hypothetical protein FE257_010893 [Aspergillus nanangensis]|uniref:Uncharacterized protein n=1 Tax=Aspergillus nanangensis TaxID=2582783 RepID=A0AAD4CVQ3_ASPNN|nr:hypothetical protein FE257_010893 [Aspergillus nanangensis]
MPSGNKGPAKMSNGMGSGLSAGNVNNVPDESNSNAVNRFSQVSASDEPYFARARMQDRSEHVSRLSNQLDATEEILKK